MSIEPESVRHALRSVRAASYRIGSGEHGTSLALVMNASEAGRRNAAAKIVGLLAEHGLALEVDEPVRALTESRAGFVVRQASSRSR
ncbi:hypothetical protein GCM10010174_89860 [Kutzneria viridogrisea]|uniref:Uncharacterized protein n=2 Tax=Kutzneria TaxID=43356 RepID=W5WG81_9PSEU|nr:hypothetical protein [Kutzneria albida]AHH99872.1 hypothetical protein KALB_6513 [Kutzneria albida DSM 43870]MBA8925053.1 hypothetical protein [Kutzneria viridogrisea]